MNARTCVHLLRTWTSPPHLLRTWTSPPPPHPNRTCCVTSNMNARTCVHVTWSKKLTYSHGLLWHVSPKTYYIRITTHKKKSEGIQSKTKNIKIYHIYNISIYITYRTVRFDMDLLEQVWGLRSSHLKMLLTSAFNEQVTTSGTTWSSAMFFYIFLIPTSSCVCNNDAGLHQEGVMRQDACGLLEASSVPWLKPLQSIQCHVPS